MNEVGFVKFSERKLFFRSRKFSGPFPVPEKEKYFNSVISICGTLKFYLSEPLQGFLTGYITRAEKSKARYLTKNKE